MKREKAVKIIDAIKSLRETLTDEVALNYVVLYPDWKIGKEFVIGERVEFEGKLYKVITAHTAQETWEPNVALTLFEPIDVVNEGDLAHPIIAAVGMTYFKDKYYLDETDGKVYLCIRDDSNGNGTALYHMPSALVGTYFELVE